jgi:4-hydroxybenzoate polyprenyltransferase
MRAPSLHQRFAWAGLAMILGAIAYPTAYAAHLHDEPEMMAMFNWALWIGILLVIAAALMPPWRNGQR